MRDTLKRLVYPLARRLRRKVQWPPVGRIDFGDLRRLKPVSRRWGYDRGRPVDRYYIEAFLAEHATDIRGRVLEIKDNQYTVAYGGDRVTRSDVLDVRADNRDATIIADLVTADAIDSDSFDAVICTQTLQLIYDIRGAIATIHRILKPGGVVLATIAGITRVSRDDMNRTGEYWRVTTASASRLFAERFGEEQVTVRAYGNLLAAISFLEGLAAEELLPEELEFNDLDYQMVIVVRAVKPSQQ